MKMRTPLHLATDDVWDERAARDLPMGRTERHNATSRTSAGGGLASWLYNRVVAPIGTKVRQVFNQGLTPELISLSFAFGVTGGLFPVPGVTMVICGVLIYLFGLNLAACQLMNIIVTPLELMMVLPFIRMGEWIFLVHEPLPFSAEKLASMLASDFFASIFALGGTFMRAIIAWALFTAVVTPLLYYIQLPLHRVLVPKLALRWS